MKVTFAKAAHVRSMIWKTPSRHRAFNCWEVVGYDSIPIVLYEEMDWSWTMLTLASTSFKGTMLTIRWTRLALAFKPGEVLLSPWQFLELMFRVEEALWELQSQMAFKMWLAMMCHATMVSGRWTWSLLISSFQSRNPFHTSLASYTNVTNLSSTSCGSILWPA
jgi:hypothetical protein